MKVEVEARDFGFVNNSRRSVADSVTLLRRGRRRTFDGSAGSTRRHAHGRDGLGIVYCAARYGGEVTVDRLAEVECRDGSVDSEHVSSVGSVVYGRR